MPNEETVSLTVPPSVSCLELLEVEVEASREDSLKSLACKRKWWSDGVPAE